MATNRVNFGEWLPDQPGVVGALTTAKNVYPRLVGYGPFPQEVSYSGNATQELNNVVAAQDTNGNTQVFASGSTRLFKFNSSTNGLDDVSLTTYDSTTKWRFTQYGNKLIGANGLNTLQSYDLTTTGNFANLSADAPKSKFITVVRDFVVAAHNPTEKFRVNWSGIGNETTWTSSATTQADYQDIPDGGNIQGITGGEFGLVLLERSIVRMSYIGTPLVFQFDNIARNLGCFEPNSVIQWQGITYFLADDGFYACNGQQVEGIGAEKVNRFFFADLEESLLGNMSAAIDPFRALVMWGYPSISDDYRILVYHIPTKRWSYAITTASRVASSSTPATTVEGLDNYSTSLDALDSSLDSRVWLGGKMVLAGVQNSRIITFTGQPKTAQIDTSDIETGTNKSMITLAKTVVDNGSGSIAFSARNLLSETVTFGNYTVASSENRVGVRSYGQFHRVSLRPSGDNWTSAIGVELDIKPAGMR